MKLLRLIVLTLFVTTAHAFSAISSKSHVEIFDPKTNVKVVLVGCLHGSLSSSNDVRYLMESEPTDAVVLELCDARFGDLTRTTVEKYSRTVFAEDVADFFSLVQDTSVRKGPFTAAITFFLGAMSLLQTNLSGFRTGLEFVVAMDIAEQMSCDVILADQDIDETMERISNVPSVSLEILKNNKIGDETRHLKCAVFGDSSLPNDAQVNMPRVMMRSKQAIVDLARLTLPPTLLVTLLTFTIAVAFHLPLFVEQESLELLVTGFSQMNADERFQAMVKVLFSSLGDIIPLAIGYSLFALPAFKVIVSERDVCLAEGIKKACQKVSNRKKGPSRVVAVLGLLHVNGVAKKLSDHSAVTTL
mmetsp:Transcript_2969/g.4367  ORF Transcript_2969/g.4367 Transcript_2969/m.4367 type:complete len:359 (+) Transcript_2969:101-1177(+)